MCGRMTSDRGGGACTAFPCRCSRQDREAIQCVPESRQIQAASHYRGGARQNQHVLLGTLPVWWKRDERGLINVKYETVRDKKTFHKDLAERRCLVLRWMAFRSGKARRVKRRSCHIRLKTGEPFAFAGVFETNKLEGKELQNFAIIQPRPMSFMQPIHNRMPVILNRDAESAWLNPDTSPEEALDILADPVPAEDMEAYIVSSNVNRQGMIDRTRENVLTGA